MTASATRPTPEQEREDYLRRVVDSIPPLTPEQRAHITAVLSPTSTPVAPRDLPAAS